MSKLSRSENQSKWFGIVDSFLSSEVSKDVFCERNNIKKATLDYWIRKRRMNDNPSPINGFTNLIPRNRDLDELRIQYQGLDVYMPITADPFVIKSLLQEFTR